MFLIEKTDKYKVWAAKQSILSLSGSRVACLKIKLQNYSATSLAKRTSSLIERDNIVFSIKRNLIEISTEALRICTSGLHHFSRTSYDRTINRRCPDLVLSSIPWFCLKEIYISVKRNSLPQISS